ncbi:hypothetical protein CW304_29795 [Bacillus sp. UFRGS-B20]|nr:hypothetical protein CW304_29795 [Bacillus sp. UFRGS-B20]
MSISQNNIVINSDNNMSTLKLRIICLSYTKCNYAFPSLTNKTPISITSISYTIIIIFFQHSPYQILSIKKEHSLLKGLIGLNRALSKNMYIHS